MNARRPGSLSRRGIPSWLAALESDAGAALGMVFRKNRPARSRRRGAEFEHHPSLERRHIAAHCAKRHAQLTGERLPRHRASVPT